MVWHYSRFETPASSLKDLPTIFHDHVSPILVTLVPFHRLLGVEGLLVAQALLVSAAAVPVFAYARRRVGERPALALAAAYLLFGGVQEAVWFDFHEVAFAPLLIALAVERAHAGAIKSAVAAALALLLVKEDLALLLPFLGLLLPRRAGLLVAAAGVAWFAGALAVVEVDRIAIGGFGDEPWMKARTLLYTFGAFLFVSLRSRVAILCVPLLAVRFLVDNPKYWTLEDHYSLTIAPVLALAAADGLRRRPQAAYAIAAIAVALIPAFPLRELVRPGAYRTAHPGARGIVERTPPGVPVRAADHLVPHLSSRRDIRLP